MSLIKEDTAVFSFPQLWSDGIHLKIIQWSSIDLCYMIYQIFISINFSQIKVELTFLYSRHLNKNKITYLLALARRCEITRNPRPDITLTNWINS